MINVRVHYRLFPAPTPAFGPVLFALFGAE